MSEKNLPTFFRDFLGVLAVAFTLFALISLMTYDPEDPSFNKSFNIKPEAISNQGGLVGAYLSDSLVQVFGSGAFFFPVITLVLGWGLIRGNEFRRWPISLGAGLLLLVSFCALLYLQFPDDPYFSSAIESGGVTGSLLATLLVTWLNTTGTKLLLYSVLFVSLLAMSGMTVNSLINITVKSIQNAIQSTVDFIVHLKNRLQLWMKDRQTEKTQKPKKKAKQEPVIVSRSLELAAKKKNDKKAKKEEKESFAVQENFSFMGELGEYRVPSLSLLDDPPEIEDVKLRKEEILASTAILEKKLKDFGIFGRVVQVLPGPFITLYEFEPAPGIKVSRILSLTDDLALAMRSPSVRILAPVPGKPVVGIEIPNRKREIVYFKEIISSDVFSETGSRLSLCLGKDNVGHPMVIDLAQVPHLLIAGSTGSGKSVGLNAMICSLLLNATPEEVKMIMVDPKMLELSMYDGIPHLIAPVVTDPKKAAAALQWAVVEMEARYKMMAKKGVRNIKGYNQLVEKLQREETAKKKNGTKASRLKATSISLADLDENPVEEKEEEVPTKLPYVVIIIDELADLMMVASKGVEESLARLAQMARAAGVHLIVATQRPSVDVLTGVIKANFPARVSYQVASRVDSRTILDSIGAEKLLGQGDMLFLPPNTSRLQRIHGAMVSDKEINRIIEFIKQQKKPSYKEEVFQVSAADEGEENIDEEFDEKYDEAVALIARERQASISMLQRKLRVGYNRAARMIEVMEKEGVVGPSDGVKPREVYVKPIVFD